MPRFLMFAIFISVVILVLVGSHFYLYVRLVRGPAWPAPWRQIGAWAIVALGASVPLVFLLSRVIPHGVARVALFVPYLWIGMMFLLVFFLLCTDILKLLGWLGLKLSGHADFFADAGRRILRDRIVAGGVLGTTVVLTIVAAITAASPPVIRKIRVELDRLPREMDGFTIAQLTDLHLGPTLHRAFLEEVVDLTNAENPDLVVITGDLVDASVERLLPALEPVRDLRAKHGIYLVTGNHEFISDVNAWLPALETLGLRVLQNERVAIGESGTGFDLAGVHDHMGGRFAPGFGPDLGKALEGRDPGRAVVLLAHQSLIIDEAEKMDVGLVLSGHNHGGQIWPWMHAVGLQQPYVSGMHRQGRTAIYVSDGTGFWGPPMRLGTRSEIVILTLVSSGKGPGS